MKSLRNTPDSLKTVNSGRFGNRSAVFLEENSSMTSQLSLNLGIFWTVDQTLFWALFHVQWWVSSKGETMRFKGNKVNLFSRNQSLSDLLYSWKFWSSKFIKPHSHGGNGSTFTGNISLLPSDVIDFAKLPAQIFWWETFSLLDVMWP